MPFLAPPTSWLSSRQRLSYSGGVESHFEADQAARNHRYAFNEAFLNNKVYRTEALGGFREQVFKDAFNLDCTPDMRLVGAYNPVPAIVDAYQNVFRGSFGQDIKVGDKVNGKPVNPTLIAEADSPLARLWRWSNLDTEKDLLQKWAANLGTVGLRVVARNDDDPDRRRVYLQLDHPSVIFDYDRDERGNVVEVELRYTARGGPVGDRRDVDVREVITKDRFVMEEDGVNVLEPEEQRNDLGVCPYVILKHRDEGTSFGRWAYGGSEDAIHWINWLIVNQGESVMEHAWPQWFAAAGGEPPQNFRIGKRDVAYTKMLPDTPTPIFEPLVAPLDQAGTLAYWNELVERLQERQPELAIVAMKVLSGQSGETIAKLQVQAESAILRARAQYEHALIRALQIGLSEGVRMALWDLGTGTGTAEAADKAFQAGGEDFEFVKRPALPPSPWDQITQADANTAEQRKKFELAAAAEKAGVDDLTQLQLAGYTEAEAKKMLARKAEEDIEPDAATGQDFRRPSNGRPVAR